MIHYTDRQLERADHEMTERKDRKWEAELRHERDLLANTLKTIRFNAAAEAPDIFRLADEALTRLKP